MKRVALFAGMFFVFWLSFLQNGCGGMKNEEEDGFNVTDMLQGLEYELVSANFASLPEPHDFNPSIKSIVEEYIRRHMVLRDGKLLFVQNLKEGDYLITFDAITIRNAVLQYNWSLKDVNDDIFIYWAADSEAELWRYGIIMRKEGDKYLPVAVETGERLAFPPRREVIEEALREVNYAAKTLGINFCAPELKINNPWSRLNKADGYGAFWVGVAAKELLDLHDVQLHWNKKSRRYEMSKEQEVKLPEYRGKSVLETFGYQLPEITDEERSRYVTNPGLLDAYNVDLGYLLYSDVDDDDPLAGRCIAPEDYPAGNAVVKALYYKSLSATSALLARRYDALVWASEPKNNTDARKHAYKYISLYRYYSSNGKEWEKYLSTVHKIAIRWTDDEFELMNIDTGKKAELSRDDTLVHKLVEQLDDYKRKIDFMEFFQIENYPLFLLSALRLYDVNLEWDEAETEYKIGPDASDPKHYLKIVPELSFVDSASDTEYLRRHFTSWLVSPPRISFDFEY